MVAAFRKRFTHSGVPTMVCSHRLRSFWIVFRKRLAFLFAGCLRSTLQLALFAIFLFYFGLPLIGKYQKEEVTNAFLETQGHKVAGSVLMYEEPRLI